MRKSLLKTFDKIYILNLHGNSNKGEPDKNVFDIKVGVSIIIFVKLDKPLPIKEKKIYYYSILENDLLKREEKFDFLLENDIESVKWKILKPKKPYYWFVKKDLSFQSEYNKGWSLNDIFNVYGIGILSKRDKLAFHFNKETLEKLREDFISLSEEKLREKYTIEVNTDWKLKKAIEDLKTEHPIVKVQYRPFDYRYTYYSKSKGFLARPAYAIMQHFLEGENIGLVFERIWNFNKKWSAVFITDCIIEQHLTSSRSCIVPLYLYIENNIKKSPDNGHLFEELAIIKVSNFTKEFNKFIEKQYSFEPTPEQILGYIYAILYSPSYREKYYEFLKIDFPKIPFTEDEEEFKRLSLLGLELIEHHLLKVKYPHNELIEFKGEGDLIVDKINHNKKHNRLYINKTQYFENVREDIYNFEIGGYKVLEKYLKSRKKRKLTYDEITHIKKIVKSLQETLRITTALFT